MWSSPVNTAIQRLRLQTLHIVARRTWPWTCRWAPYFLRRRRRTANYRRNRDTRRSVRPWVCLKYLYPSCCARPSIRSQNTGGSRIGRCSRGGCASSCLYGWCFCRWRRWRTRRSIPPPSNNGSHSKAQRTRPETNRTRSRVTEQAIRMWFESKHSNLSVKNTKCKCTKIPKKYLTKAVKAVWMLWVKLDHAFPNCPAVPVGQDQLLIGRIGVKGKSHCICSPREHFRDPWVFTYTSSKTRFS